MCRPLPVHTIRFTFSSSNQTFSTGEKHSGHFIFGITCRGKVRSVTHRGPTSFVPAALATDPDDLSSTSTRLPSVGRREVSPATRSTLPSTCLSPGSALSRPNPRSFPPPFLHALRGHRCGFPAPVLGNHFHPHAVHSQAVTFTLIIMWYTVPNIGAQYQKACGAKYL